MCPLYTISLAGFDTVEWADRNEHTVPSSARQAARLSPPSLTINRPAGLTLLCVTPLSNHPPVPMQVIRSVPLTFVEMGGAALMSGRRSHFALTPTANQARGD